MPDPSKPFRQDAYSPLSHFQQVRGPQDPGPFQLPSDKGHRMVPAAGRMTHGDRMPKYRAGPDLSTAVYYFPVCISSPLHLHRDLAYEKKHMETQSNETSG